MEENKPEPELPIDFPERSENEEKAPEIPPEPPTPVTFSGKPRTISELNEFCRSRGMPLEKMRFFIGEDYLEPRAFGIYQSGDEFVVYKNKADGSRAVRYRGRDEAYAVSELYEKLLDECHMRGIYPERDGSGSGTSYLSSVNTGTHHSSGSSGTKTEGNKGCVYAIVAVILLFYRWLLFLIQWVFRVLFLVVVQLINPIVAAAAAVSFILARKFIPQDRFSSKVRTALLIGIPLSVIIAGQFIRSARNGYYADRSVYYYRDNETWYQGRGNSWSKLNSKPEFSGDQIYYSSRSDMPFYIGDVTDSYIWNQRYFVDYPFPRFPTDPGIVDDLFRGGSGRSSDSSWDWDSWDSSDTDWDSDW